MEEVAMNTGIQGEYAARFKRIDDAITLKVPDRIPIWFQDLSFFPAKYAGITSEEAMYDDNKFFGAYKTTIRELGPDMYFNPEHFLHTPGDALEAVDCKQVKWPGHGVSPTHTFQFVEEEYMKANEYKAFLDDPTDYTLRVYMPRVLGCAEPFQRLPPFKTFLMGYFGLPISFAYADPQFLKALESFYKTALIVTRHNAAAAAFNQEMKNLGYPLGCGAIALTPFDILSDTLRGMRGLMLDMYRQPENILAAIDKLMPMVIDSTIGVARASGVKGVFIPLHRGAHGFMSIKQFEKFYWPGLEKLLLTLIEADLTPFPFFEGDYGSRLDFLAELPKGKILGLFDTTDPVKAKQIIGKTMCISGMMPLSMLQTGTAEQIRDQAKYLIDTVGKDGGYIMGPRSAMDECDPERVKIWVDFTKEYGKYG